jgi:hypothetical protein
MPRVVRVVIVGVALFLSAHRLPAPIVEETSPSTTPAPAHSAKPKPTVKSKASESSGSSAKTQTSPVAPKTQPIANRNPFDGTWIGTLERFYGDRTLVIIGQIIIEKGTQVGTHTWNTTRDGGSVRWSTPIGCAWSLTPNADGNSAMVTVNCSGFMGVGSGSASAIFHRQQQ